jgi:hypothetical protein
MSSLGKRYQNKPKNINNPKGNAVDVDFYINKYDDVITSLKSEVDDLRHHLAVKTHDQHLQSMSI